MKLKELGKTTLRAEVTNIDNMGFWLLVDEKEHYLSFEDFPWFIDSSIRKIIRVERESENHFHWPDLDVDLTLDMIDQPEAYPLKYK